MVEEGPEPGFGTLIMLIESEVSLRFEGIGPNRGDRIALEV